MTTPLSRPALRHALPAVVLALMIATPVAMGAIAKGNGVYATSKYSIALLVNSSGTALRNASMSCTKKSHETGFADVTAFFKHGRAIARRGAFAFSGSALYPAGKNERTHLTLHGRFVSKKKAVGVIRSPACFKGKRVHFTALYRGK
jgi:hypothetical protein